jgi:thioredoxin 1
MIYLKEEKEFEVLTKEGLVLVDFYADWCGPCQMLTPILEELAKKNKELKIVKINVDEFQQLAIQNKVLSIPAIKIYRDGKLVNQTVGYQELEDLETLIK